MVTERVYVVPRGDGRLVVGATVEEQGFDTRVTAGGVHELLREAYRALPEIAELELVEATAGLRPATPDNLPLIGPGAIDGLVLATGHFRNGILLAPLTADRIAGRLLDRPSRAGGGGAMTIELNGERVELAAEATVAAAVERLGAERRAPRGRGRGRRRGRPAQRVGADPAQRGPARRGRGGDPGWLSNATRARQPGDVGRLRARRRSGRRG